MLVKVEFVIETADFGKDEFRKEIENLINDIDSSTILHAFDMYKVPHYFSNGNESPKNNEAGRN